MEYKVKRAAKSRTPRSNRFRVARVLLVDDNPASRLTLQTLLEAGGYCVDAAASAAEAVGKLERQEYELVLSDLEMESPKAGLKVLAHARLMEYRPATALISTYLDSTPVYDLPNGLLVEPEDVPELLTKVAQLIGDRATRQVERQLRAAVG